jgi:hypothetical protein
VHPDTNRFHRHYPRIGLDAVREQIDNIKYDAFQCSTLAKNTELSPNDPQGRQYKELTIVNADTYVWYALVSYLL